MNKISIQPTVREDLQEKYEIEFIKMILLDIKGLGKTVAEKIANNMASFDFFVNSNKKKLKDLKTADGKNIIKENLIESVYKKIKEIRKIILKNTIQDIRHIIIMYLTKGFLDKQVINIEAKNLEDMDINPHLAFLLQLNKNELIKFFVTQTILRSIVTSWGMNVEKFLIFSGCDFAIDSISVGIKDVKGSQPDLFKIIEDTIYGIQAKSGPNTMNVEMVTGLNKAIEKIESIPIKEIKRNLENDDLSNIKILLGMTYGTRSRISSQIKDNLNDFEKTSKIGRELWDFVAEKEGYYIEVLDLIIKASDLFLKRKLMALINDKIKEITIQWNNKYNDVEIYEVLKEHYI